MKAQRTSYVRFQMKCTYESVTANKKNDKWLKNINIGKAGTIKKEYIFFINIFVFAIAYTSYIAINLCWTLLFILSKSKNKLKIT